MRIKMFLLCTIFFLVCFGGFFGIYIFRKNNIQKELSNFYVDFDTSMQIQSYPDLLKHADVQYVLKRFKSLYEQHNFKQVTSSTVPTIPLFIHIMWLGGRLPDEYRAYVQSWHTFHPQWTFIFWTDNERNYDQGTLVVHSFEELASLLQSKAQKNIVVDARQLQFDNKLFYDQAINYGEKSDILKWEIVYRFGGVYVDIDFECLRPLDALHYVYDFYTGIQPLDTNLAQLGAALYAARPGHPILEQCVKTIKDNQHIKQIISKTGPIHFTRVFLALAGKTGLKDIALPTSYLYPCAYEQKGKSKEIWCKPESFAVHHWAGSWLKPEGFVNYQAT
jgi:mannosyltransferase OCH1-like enzyme